MLDHSKPYVEKIHYIDAEIAGHVGYINLAWNGRVCVGVSVVRRKFSWGGGWLRVIWWPFVFGLRCLWRHSLTSFPRFQTNVLAKFV